LQDRAWPTPAPPARTAATAWAAGQPAAAAAAQHHRDDAFDRGVAQEPLVCGEMAAGNGPVFVRATPITWFGLGCASAARY